jgi:VWFA-related protein
MSVFALAVVLLGQAAPAAAPGTEIRSLTATILDEKGGEVTDLSPRDVALTENGVTRDVVSFRPDTRPLSVALIVDTSLAVGSSYRLNLVDAVTGFIARLPEGARYAVWTTGDRPTKVLDYTADREAAGKALRLVAPQGGNYVLDALVEASEDLQKLVREGDRAVVVTLTSSGPELSYRDRYRSAEEAERTGALFLSAHIESSETGFEERTNVSYVLDRVAAASGGRRETLLSPMGADHAMRRLSAALRSGYRISYASVPDLKRRKVELKVARPKTKVLLPSSTETGAASSERDF